MRKVVLLGRWLWQAWPVWAIAGVASVNYGLFRLIGYNRPSVHIVAGPVFQIIGGAFVLYFLNKNMGVFNRGTLTERVRAWARAFPLWKKHHILHAQSGSMQIHGGGNATVRLVRRGETVQEQLEILKNLIEEHHKEMKDIEKRLLTDLESIRNQLRSEIDKKSKEIAEVRSLLASTVVGSVNPGCVRYSV